MRGGGGGRNHAGHLADHRQHQLLIAIGKSGAVALDLAEEAQFVLGKLAQHFLGVAIARRFGAGEKVGQADLHGFGNLRQRLQRRHGMAVLHAGEIAAQQARAAFDIALRKPALSAVTANHLTDVNFWLFFWHRDLKSGYLTQCSKRAQENYAGKIN